MPGPAPKRTEQRRRRNAPARPVVKPTGAATCAPPLGLEDVHPLAAEWYASLAGSPESRFFTPAVWQRARINAQVLSQLLKGGRLSSQLYAAVQNDWKALLVDPAEQRRLGIEVQAAAPVDDDAERADATVTSLMAKIVG